MSWNAAYTFNHSIHFERFSPFLLVDEATYVTDECDTIRFIAPGLHNFNMTCLANRAIDGLLPLITALVRILRLFQLFFLISIVRFPTEYS